MQRVAAYARYSTDQQRPTSIDDQIARCARLAERHGLTISPPLTFSDSAVSGSKSGTEKRKGYRRLIDAIEAGQVDVLVADEISRLSRHITEGGRLMDMVDEKGIRIITHDGVDTDTMGWRQLWAFKLMQAQHEVETTADRSIRGTFYQLARDRATAQAPFGYRMESEFDDQGKKAGAKWVIDEEQAALVREIYDWRHSGMSLFAIAERLKSRGVLPPRPQRCKRASRYWRPSSLQNLLRNTIYRGVYVYRGSYPCQLRARKRRKVLETVEFQRPTCRIVTDEVWFAVNRPRSSPSSDGKARVPYGSGRHLLAGLVECSTCSCRLTVLGSKRWKVAGCQSCRDEHKLGRREFWTGYAPVRAVSAALHWSIEQLFTGKVRDEYRRRLRAKLTAGPAQELREARQRLQSIDEKLARVKGLTLDPTIGIETFRNELRALVSGKDEAEAEIKRLEERSNRLSPELADALMKADPRKMLHGLLDGEEEAWKARATLRRAIATFKFLERRDDERKFIFEIALLPGQAAAETVGVVPVDRHLVAFRVVVTVHQWVADGEIVEGTRLQ